MSRPESFDDFVAMGEKGEKIPMFINQIGAMVLNATAEKLTPAERVRVALAPRTPSANDINLAERALVETQVGIEEQVELEALLREKRTETPREPHLPDPTQ